MSEMINSKGEGREGSDEGEVKGAGAAEMTKGDRSDCGRSAV